MGAQILGYVTNWLRHALVSIKNTFCAWNLTVTVSLILVEALLPSGYISLNLLRLCFFSCLTVIEMGL